MGREDHLAHFAVFATVFGWMAAASRLHRQRSCTHVGDTGSIGRCSDGGDGVNAIGSNDRVIVCTSKHEERRQEIVTDATIYAGP